MEKKNLSTKEFNAIVKGAKVELNGIFKSPFIVINLLNKAAKGDLSKINGCNIKPENLKKVAGELKRIHGNRYAFIIDVLPKCEGGQIGYFVEVPEKQNELANISNGEIVNFGKKELIVNDGNVGIFNPIPCTINGIFNAFAKVAKVDILATEKQAKERAKIEKKQAKERAHFEKAKKSVFSAFGNDFANTLTDAQILEKYEIIRKIK